MAQAEAEVSGVPKVSLPPVTLRIENLEFDALGYPYFKFPPFLSPPEGVTLIPFVDFKPHGIQISYDSDQEEIDGDGIPTTELGVKHEINEKDKDKRKKRKRKKDADEPKKTSTWWEDWAEGEDLRSASVFDPNVPRSERFTAGVVEFGLGRKFSPAVQSLYDHFRLYSGLLAAPKHDRYEKDNGDEVMDEDDDDEAEFIAEGAAAAQEAEYSAPVTDVVRDNEESRIEEVDDEQDIRMDAFLNDPEKSMKIFFSSFFKDKGLTWSDAKLRDGPILLSFFLAFFVRNRIMPDYEKAFIKAHRIAEKARLELPQTTKISMALPDVFGRACTGLWGATKAPVWSDRMDDDVDPTSASAPETTAPEWETHLEEHGLEKVDVNLAEPPIPNGTDDSAPQGASAGEAPMTGGWGNDASMDPWAVTQNDWNPGELAPSLMEILGPTTLPLTHNVQRAEKSTRQIVAFAPPREDGTALERVLGTVVLAPWKKYFKDTPIARPEMLMDNAADGAFDPGQHLIHAFVDPKVVNVLREGMGLYGLFVQVVRQEGSDPPSEKKPKSRKKGKGKAKDVNDRMWWYVEFLYEVLPSFWTEEGELE